MLTLQTKTWVRPHLFKTSCGIDALTLVVGVVSVDDSKLSLLVLLVWLSFAPWLLFRLNKLIARLRTPPSRFGPIVASRAACMLSGSDVRNAGASGRIPTAGRWPSRRSLDRRPASLLASRAAADGRLCADLSSLGVLGRLGRSECVVSFLDAIHFVFVISSRATGSTGTSGCWNATLTQPRQLRPDGMN